MDVVLGSTGRVGRALVEALLAKGRAVRAVTRNAGKAEPLRNMGASVVVADFADAGAVRPALAGGDVVFILTAEDPGGHDALAEARAFLDACRDAVRSEGVGRIIGLSSDGAQHAAGTGMLVASHMLEHAFDDVDVEKTFIRPSYYFSNWMASLAVVTEHGFLPTFFPPDLSIPMISPADVGRYAAAVFAEEVETRPIHEITGPRPYTSTEIARTVGEIFGREVRAQQVPESNWLETLTRVGFSPANARHMAAMTAAVISGLTAAEGEMLPLPTTFSEYAREVLAERRN